MAASRLHWNLLQLAGSATIICVLPLPRYVRHPCGNDELHMVNWAEADFNEILVSTSTACFSVLNTEGEKHGHIRSSAGLSIWREDERFT